jgi:hypothetical protein
MRPGLFGSHFADAAQDILVFKKLLDLAPTPSCASLFLK